MADDASREPFSEAGQTELSLQSSSSAPSLDDHPTIATTFPQFAFLPEEIRRLIWQYACIPTRMHFFEFPMYRSLRRVGPLSDPADAPFYNYDGVRDDLAKLIANSENCKQQWNVPGCHRFRRFFWRRDLNGLSAVCPEARAVYLSFVKRAEQSRLRIKEGVYVDDSFDIFHFSIPCINWYWTSFLLNMRPKLRPINLAINVSFGGSGSNFYLLNHGKSAAHKFPNWLSGAIKWGREAKEGYNNSPATTLTPSIDDVMIDLQDLQAVFLLDWDIKLRQHSQHDAADQITTNGESSCTPALINPLPSAHQYNVLAHGMDGDFYGLSPGNEEVMRHWDVPAHIWPVLEETKRVLKCSDHWKVNIYFMASVSKKVG